MTTCWLGDTGTYWICGETLVRGSSGGSARPPWPRRPYLGLLQEWGSLLVLDVCDLALLNLEEATPVKLSCGLSPRTPAQRPGPAYLDVMALRDHDILLRKQVLDAVLGDDVLDLPWGRGEQVLGPSAGAWQGDRPLHPHRELQARPRGG